MYCHKCGTQLPDDANYCMTCGVPQKQGAMPKERKWQLCSIEYQEGYFLGKSKLMAKAIGSEGVVVIAEETVPHNSSPAKTIEILIARLVADGWEHTGKGDTWYSYQFRRPA